MNNQEEWIAERSIVKITAKDEFLIFEGNIVMFRNCFFDNAELSSVLDWADREGFTVELISREKSMIVYLVIQNEGAGRGSGRVRGVFSTKEKAQNYIGPIEKRNTTCECCKQDRPNPRFSSSDDWKKKLRIQEKVVDCA